MAYETAQLQAVLQPACYDPALFREKIREAVKWLEQNEDACRQSNVALLDPWRIDPRLLVGDGILTEEEWSCMDLDREEDPQEFRQNQEILLTMAYERSNISRNPEYQQFLRKNAWWLEECALFLALDRFFAPMGWQQWPEDIRYRYGYALDYYRRELYFDAEFQMYLQFLCYRQEKSGTDMEKRAAAGV